MKLTTKKHIEDMRFVLTSECGRSLAPGLPINDLCDLALKGLVAEVDPLERLILESAIAWYRAGIRDCLTSEDYEGHSLTEGNACAALVAAQLDSLSMNGER